MQATIYIAKWQDGSLSILHQGEIRLGEKQTLARTTVWESDGEECYQCDRWVPVTIERSFVVAVTGRVLRNPNDNSPLNGFMARTGGFGTNHLMYAYSVNIVEFGGGSLYESSLVYSESGIRATNFNMYSYHTNEPVQEYREAMLEYEAMGKVDLTKALAKYLAKADLRDAALKNLGI